MRDQKQDNVSITDFCSGTSAIRTSYVGVDNYTKWKVVFAEFRCIDESGSAPANFTFDTGWFVAATNVTGPANTHTDICVATGRAIQATKVLVRYKLQWENNPPLPQTETELSDGDTSTYYDHAAVELKYTGSADSKGQPEVILQLPSVRTRKK